MYAKHQYGIEKRWTQSSTKTYLQTCCLNGDLILNLIQNGDQAVPPDLWLRHEEYGVQIENFPDAPMHLLFLGITKHILGNVERLFNNKKVQYKKFCTIISAHLECGSKLSLDWCHMSQFSDNEGITTAGWQSDQFLAFARISLVYFGLSYDYCEEIEKNRIIAF